MLGSPALGAGSGGLARGRQPLLYCLNPDGFGVVAGFRQPTKPVAPLKSTAPPSYFNPVGTRVSRVMLHYLVPREGIEPPRPCDRWILSPLRLPVPPSRHT